MNTAALNNQTTSPSDSRTVNSQTNVKPSGVVVNPEQNSNLAVRHGNPAPAKSQPPFNETLAGQQKGQRKHWDQSPNNDATASLLAGQLVTMARATTCESRRPRQARTGLLHSEEKWTGERQLLNASFEICRSQHKDHQGHRPDHRQTSPPKIARSPRNGGRVPLAG